MDSFDVFIVIGIIAWLDDIAVSILAKLGISLASAAGAFSGFGALLFILDLPITRMWRFDRGREFAKRKQTFDVGRN